MVARRSSLVTLLVSAVGAFPVLAYAQEKRTARPLRIGLVPDFMPVWWDPLLKLLTQALAELGRVEGRDYEFIRSGVYYGPDAQQALDRVFEKNPDMILASGLGYVIAAHKVTKSIPIVMWVSGFPVDSGVVENLARPGGNVTGLTAYASGEVFSKLVQLLHDVKPDMKRIGALMNYVPPFHPIAETKIANGGMQRAAKALGIDLRIIEIASADQVDDALATVVREHIEALVLTSAPTTRARWHDILRFAIERHLPTITDAGWESVGDPQPLMDYEPDFVDLIRKSATYIDNILWKGAKPGELPIQLPTRFVFRINLKTAAAIGLTVPRAMRARADEIVE